MPAESIKSTGNATGKTTKTIVITGAGRGIGLELTRQALNAGHTVLACVRRPSTALELRDLESTYQGRLKLLTLDVGSDESASDLAKMFANDLKLSHIDLLINNAGILSKDDGTVDAAPASVVMQTLDTNSVGPLRVTQALLPFLRKAKSGVVANISSQMGSIADNSSGSSVAYRMSKAALNMFVKTLSLDEPNLIALALHPGWVKTEMGGPQAPLQVEGSASGLLSVIEKATSEDSGKFLNYSGKALPW